MSEFKGICEMTVAEICAELSDLMFIKTAPTDIQIWRAHLLAEEVWSAPGHLKLEMPENLINALVKTGLATSLREARDFLKAGAIFVNGIKQNSDITLNGAPGYIIRKKRESALVIFSCPKDLE